MTQSTIYDEIRYSSYPYVLTHPDRLATVAALHGLPSPEPATARVLEIGCGAGGNLLAMAAATPGIRALGVDLASGPIEEGRALAAAAGIDNVELRQGDIMDITGGELGEFDFIVAHGVYTWIPEEARGALLSACHAHLAADGVAVISHNTYPGGYMRQALREGGLWFARHEDGALAQAQRAKQLYRMIVEERGGSDDWWGKLLENQGDAFAYGPDYRLVHDDLSEHWQPVWFGAFAERAAGHGLAYVGDSDLARLLPRWVPEFTQSRAMEMAGGDRITLEQITDLLRCAFFRHSVFCRDSRTPDVVVRPDVLRGLHFGVRGDEDGPGSELLASTLALLRSRAPDTVAFSELRAATAAGPDELAEALLTGFMEERIMPHRAPLVAVSPAGVERPVASPLARQQAARAKEITTRAYGTVVMEEPAARVLLQLLDGTRNRAEIRAEFTERTGVPLSPEDLEDNLERLGKLYLLSES
jgi:2-polyprenyl-3-methyl-5-hydroxy-6-metoxy-1,4-benzoquinol methylase